MLVLSRQRDESIIIGDDIEITVVDIRGDKVRLGVTAPKEISVHRKEVYDAIRRENREAAQVKPEDVPGIGKIRPGIPRHAGPLPGGPKPPAAPKASGPSLPAPPPAEGGAGSVKGESPKADVPDSNVQNPNNPDQK